MQIILYQIAWLHDMHRIILVEYLGFHLLLFLQPLQTFQPLPLLRFRSINVELCEFTKMKAILLCELCTKDVQIILKNYYPPFLALSSLENS